MSWQINMAIVLLVVWGGFALCIKKTMTSEAEKE
ncbi:MAG TPA: MetS family NSS transporter small subunit [Synergistaceae bacterium]|nr:MetS family NSS transporter small subunit [Synergistaceae bacterium]